MSRLAATLYAAESMRLTTRLMQVASWLLLQRAANNGEMTRAQVADEKTKVRLDTPSASISVPSWEELPAKFKDIVEQSLKLQALCRQARQGHLWQQRRGCGCRPIRATMSKTSWRF